MPFPSTAGTDVMKSTIPSSGRLDRDALVAEEILDRAEPLAGGDLVAGIDLGRHHPASGAYSQANRLENAGRARRRVAGEHPELSHH